MSLKATRHLSSARKRVRSIYNTVRAAGVAAAIVPLAACGWFGDENTFRYRLTVAVESGGEVYAGSSVIQVEVVRQELRLLSQTTWASKVTGDAVVVDVPKHNPIFVLLSAKTADWDAAIAFKMFRQRLPNPRESVATRDNMQVMTALRETAEIPAELYPTIVGFGDLSRPETVYVLPPDDLSRALGSGSRVVRMTIEMTDDRVTTGKADDRLPWLAEIATHLDGDPYQTTGKGLANTLSQLDFRKRGI